MYVYPHFDVLLFLAYHFICICASIPSLSIILFIDWFRVDDVDFELSPLNEFEKDGERISYVEYFRDRWGLEVTRPETQPLLIHRCQLYKWSFRYSYSRIRYYLGGKNLSVRLHAYLRLESTKHQKIGEINKALQICKRLTQTASV